MKIPIKLITVILFGLILFFTVGIRSTYSLEKISDISAYLETSKKNKLSDGRAEILSSFLSSHRSELTPYAKEIVFYADKYEIDWKLLVAISGVESSFCKKIPPQSANCWGWNNGKRFFKNYQEAIETISQALKQKYYDRGLTDPFKIGPVYAPPNPYWGAKVNFFMEQIENFPSLTLGFGVDFF